MPDLDPENAEARTSKGTLPSLKLFLIGIAPWAIFAIGTKLRLLGSFGPVALILTILMLLMTPSAFTMGFRRARAEGEHGGLRPHVSRWLNLVALVCYFLVVGWFVADYFLRGE